MRKQLLGVFLPLLILVLVATAAETQSTGAGTTTHAALQRINVVRGQDSVSLEMTTRGAVRSSLFATHSKTSNAFSTV